MNGYNGDKKMKQGCEAEKNRAYAYLDGIEERLYGFADTVRKTPELGFRERKTSAFVEERMREIGLYNVRRVALTGVAAELFPPKEGEERVCVIGELDAVLTPDCPYADPATGAAHTCGHNIQIAELLGVAEALKNSGVAESLGGNVTFLAVPAEEFVDADYREGLRAEGKIRALSGKLELLSDGFFDGMSCAMMVHAQPNCPEPTCFVECNSLGFVAKTVHFRGKAAHAGGAPWDGINALNAAMAAMMCINAMRETFRDSDKIRVHPIITKGGDLVNVVPADVTMETYVRGATPEAITDAAAKVDRAIRGAAYAIGAEVEIRDIGAYAPLRQDHALSALFADNARGFLPEERIISGVDMVGSTDMGDVSLALPAIQPTCGGYNGGAHAADFRVTDNRAAILLPTKLMTATVIDLLVNGAERAAEIRRSFAKQHNKRG